MLTRKTNTFLALIAIVAISFSFRVAPANFSGTWKLNEGKSELPQFGVVSKLVIDQKTEGISVARTSRGFDGNEVVTTDNLVEGKETETTVFGSAKKKSTLKWDADGQGFSVAIVIAGDFNGNAFEVKGSDTWTISADGKVVTLVGKYSGPQGETTSKMVYDKQ